jgi:hypothetical protein
MRNRALKKPNSIVGDPNQINELLKNGSFVDKGEKRGTSHINHPARSISETKQTDAANEILTGL